MKTAVVCPGGQGDLSVYGNLLFMSVEENRGKKDCSLTPAATADTRMRGVRIFDISNIEAPVQVAQVQTCRGSHTHTLVEGKDSPDSVYIYVQGTAGVRNAAELTGPYAQEPTMRPGCDGGPATNPNPSLWRIEVIRVPLAAPQNAAIVSEPRLFRDEATGAVNGLQNQVPTPNHPSGIGWGPTPVTTACHDITVLEEKDLAAGSCAGNGILIDISEPANPRRIDAVSDPDWAYWHGATFSNDGDEGRLHGRVGRRHQPALPRDRPAQLGRGRPLRHRQPQELEVPQRTASCPCRPDHAARTASAHLPAT